MLAGRPAGLPGHLGRCRGLIQEDERGGIELRLQGGPGGAAGGDVGAVLSAGMRCFFEDDPMAAGELVDRTQREELAPLRDQPLPHFGESEVGRLLYGAQQQVGLRLDTAGELDTQCHNYQSTSVDKESALAKVRT